MKFNIDGLDDNLKYITKSRVYGLAVTNPNWLDNILCQLIGRNIVLLTYKDPAEHYENLLKTQNRNLKIFQIKQNKVINKKVSIDRLCLEMGHLISNESLILIDFSKVILSTRQSTRQHIQKLKNFCLENGHSMILLVSFDASYQKISESWQDLSGVVIIKGVDRPQKLHINHWFGSQHMVSHIDFEIVEENNQIQLVNQPSHLTEVNQRIDIVTPVIIDQHYSELGKVINNDWIISHSTKELQKQAMLNRNATILLHFHPEKSLKEIAKLAYKLRKACGKKLKIIIIEVGFRLRSTEQDLLKNIGASMVLPSEISISTLTSIIQAIKNLDYKKSLSDDFDLIYDSAGIPETIGYLSPDKFIKNVKKMLNSAASHNLDFALINLFVPPGVNPLDTVKFCQFNRNGDIYTLFDSSVYVFLYGCKEEHIDNTLAYIFGMEVEISFKHQENYIHIESTQIQLLKINKNFNDFLKRQDSGYILQKPKDSSNRLIKVQPERKLVARPAQPFKLRINKDPK